MINILICHYKPLEDRREYLESELKKFNVIWFDNYNRNSLLESDMKLYEYDPKKFIEYTRIWGDTTEPRLCTLGEIANGITHIKMYEYIIENNLDYALILEDDCIILNNFEKELEEIIKELPSDFDTCFIGDAFGWTVENYKFGFFGSFNKNVIVPNKKVYPMKSGKTADAYLISKNGAKKMLKYLKPFCLPIDYMHNYIFMKESINNYWSKTPLTHAGSQDIYESSMGRDNGVLKYKEYKGLNKSFPEFYNQRKLEPRRKNALINFTEMIKNNQNFIIVKFGDGELTNMFSTNEHDHNCDGNNYFKELGTELIEAYIYYLRIPYAYICKWDHVYHIEEKIEEDLKNWFKYDDKFLEYNIIIHKLPFKEEQINFFKTIKYSSRKKMYVTNKEMLDALIPIMNIKLGVVIPDRNSYLYKKQIIDLCSQQIEKEPDGLIILFSAGMFSKVLIKELSMKFPKHTYIDIGSTFDGLIKGSRDFNYMPQYKQELLKWYS